MFEEFWKLIPEKYPMKELDTGVLSCLRAQGMLFQVSGWDAEGLGRISRMQASGFFGLMKMDTLIVNPTEIDMPLLSYDRIFAMGNDTLIFEVYDTFLQQRELPAAAMAKAQGSGIPEHDMGAHWYDPIKLPVSFAKKGKKRQTPEFNRLAEEFLRGYLSDCGDAPVCDPAAKREKASVYVEGLLSNGGPSTDVFQKALGAEKTAELFRKILFGIEE